MKGKEYSIIIDKIYLLLQQSLRKGPRLFYFYTYFSIAGIFKIIEFLKFPTGCVMIFPLNYGNKDNYYHY